MAVILMRTLSNDANNEKIKSGVTRSWVKESGMVNHRHLGGRHALRHGRALWGITRANKAG